MALTAEPRPQFNSPLLTVQTRNDIIVTDIDMLRSTRLCRDTLLTPAVTVSHCSEIRCSFGPLLVQARLGPGDRDGLR